MERDMNLDPKNNKAEEKKYDAESQEINKDPIIGGADDVYRENPSDDLYDSDLVDEEPLQEDVDHVQQMPDNQDSEDLETPLDGGDDEDEEIINLEETQDLMGGDSAIDDETTI